MASLPPVDGVDGVIGGGGPFVCGTREQLRRQVRARYIRAGCAPIPSWLCTHFTCTLLWVDRAHSQPWLPLSCGTRWKSQSELEPRQPFDGSANLTVCLGRSPGCRLVCAPTCPFSCLPCERASVLCCFVGFVIHIYRKRLLGSLQPTLPARSRYVHLVVRNVICVQPRENIWDSAGRRPGRKVLRDERLKEIRLM